MTGKITLIWTDPPNWAAGHEPPGATSRQVAYDPGTQYFTLMRAGDDRPRYCQITGELTTGSGLTTELRLNGRAMTQPQWVEKFIGNVNAVLSLEYYPTMERVKAVAFALADEVVNEMKGKGR